MNICAHQRVAAFSEQHHRTVVTIVSVIQVVAINRHGSNRNLLQGCFTADDDVSYCGRQGIRFTRAIRNCPGRCAGGQAGVRESQGA